jgi:hypothetical protein
MYVEEENCTDEASNIPFGTPRHRRKIILKWMFKK